MKKVLLLFLLCLSLQSIYSQSQSLWFNELSPDPGKSGQNAGDEYIEFFNTSGTKILLDCYVVISYFDLGSNKDKGVYVYNFPTGSEILPFSTYLISSNNPVRYKTGTYNPGANNLSFSNWNNPNLVGGYISKYVYTNGTWSTPQSVGASFNDFMDITGGNDASLLLYRINANGTTTLINGFFANNSGTIPSTLSGFNPLTNLPVGSAACSSNPTTTINFNGITVNNVDVFQITSAAGANNGYAKKGNGACGTWVKIQNQGEFSPNALNSLGSVTSSITADEINICGTKVDFTITSGASQSSPVIVELYQDDAVIGTLDANDELIGSSTISSSSSTVYSIPIPDPYKNTPVILVYRSPAGCFLEVVTPRAATGAILTTQRIACQTTVFFRIDGLQGDLTAANAFPLTVKLYKDGGMIGSLGTGDELLQTYPNVISGSGATWYAFNNVTAGSGPFLISYETPNSCFNKAVVPPTSTGDLTPSQINYCNRRIDFSVAGTGDIQLLPYVDVYVFNDINNNDTYDAPTEAIGTGQPIRVSTFPSQTYTVTIPEATQNAENLRIKLYYQTFVACYDEVQLPAAATGQLTTSQAAICALNASEQTRIVYNAQGATGNAATGAFPMTIQLYYDLNGNKQVDISDGPPKQQVTINAFMNGAQEFLLPTADREQAVVLVYKTALGCFDKPVDLSPDCIPLPVRFASFTATRSRQNKQQVDLSWTTAMEQNNKGFHVQRKTEGEWKNIAFVFSAANNGNSSQPINYQLKDQNGYRGVSQYRLLQVDIDGKATFSDVKSLMGIAQQEEVLVLPNPAQGGKINLVFADNSSRNIVLSDINGRIVGQYRNYAAGNLTIENLQAGMYFIQVTNTTTGTAIQQKVLVQ